MVSAMIRQFRPPERRTGGFVRIDRVRYEQLACNSCQARAPANTTPLPPPDSLRSPNPPSSIDYLTVVITSHIPRSVSSFPTVGSPRHPGTAPGSYMTYQLIFGLSFSRPAHDFGCAQSFVLFLPTTFPALPRALSVSKSHYQ